MQIKHVYGNVLRIDIPLTIKIRTIEEGVPSEREEPFYPDATKGCIVELANNYNRKIEYEATINDNIAHIEDIGKISIGKYKLTVKCYDADGNPYRYMVRDIVEICDATADAGIDVGVEFNAETYTLEGAVFISYVSGSFEQVQADWTEADTHSKSYIKNKPTSLVEDENYVHTDNNFSYEEKQKLSTLENYDDTGVKGLINTEKQRAESVEEGLSTSINNIGRVIPAQASAQNQLADKEFVNHSIATNTANFKGTYNSVSELSNITDATNNDYAFVIVTDAQGNQFYDRYKYNGTTWLYEYRVESTAFTAQQWAAIQSGITSSLVAKLSDLPTNEALQDALTLINTTLSGKQDTISDLAEIRSGASAGATAYQKPAGGIPASDIANGVLPNVSDKESKMAIVETDSSNTIQAEVGKCYTFSQRVNTLAISLPAPNEKTYISNIMMYFKTGATPAVTITSEETLLYQDGYEIDANTRYELNCLFNGREWVVAAMKIGEE